MSSEDYLDSLLKDVMGVTPSDKKTEYYSNSGKAKASASPMSIDKVFTDDSVNVHNHDHNHEVIAVNKNDATSIEDKENNSTVNDSISNDSISNDSTLNDSTLNDSTFNDGTLNDDTSKDINSKVLTSESLSNDSLASEIPVNVNTNGMVIDSAPSLAPNNFAETSQSDIDSDVSDLMADIMPSFDAGLDSASQEADELRHNTINEMMAEFEAPFNTTFEVPVSEGMTPEMLAAELPDLPVMPDIPEVKSIPVEPENDNAAPRPQNEKELIASILNNELNEYNLEPITAENFDEVIAKQEYIETAGSDEAGVMPDNAVQDFSSDIEDIKKELLSSELDEDDSLGADDIDYLLKRAQASELESNKELSQTSNMSLDDIISTTNDSEAEMIGELLGKADRNEAIDDEIIALLGNQNRISPELDTDNQVAPLDAKEARKAEKKRLKAEKAEAKKQAKARKAEEKRLAKAAKKGEPISETQGYEPSVNGSENIGPAVTNNDANGNDAGSSVPVNLNKNIGGTNNSDDMSDIDELLSGADAKVPVNLDKNAINRDNDISGSTGEVAGNNHGMKPEDIASQNYLLPEGSVGWGSFDLEGEGFESDTQENVLGNIDAAGNAAGNGDIARNADIAGNIDTAGNSDAAGSIDPANDSIDVDASGNADAQPKKKNPFKAFIDKIIGILTEDEDEDDEASEIILSQENADILDELNAEGGKKGKKKKAKKGKKGNDADEITNPEDLPEKKEKKKKEKKPKKNPEKEASREKKIPTKSIVLIMLVCAMFGVLLFVFVHFTGDYSIKRAGRIAYNNKDYQTCYQNLFGKELNETEQIMYNQSECILKIRLWLREYEILEQDGAEVQALDSLIQSINAYPGLYIAARESGCLEEVEETYREMFAILGNKYGLTEEDAIAIASEKDDVVYTRIVTAIANGVTYQDALNRINGVEDSSGEVDSEVQTPVIPEIKDKLPEEEGMSGNSFIEPK